MRNLLKIVLGVLGVFYSFYSLSQAEESNKPFFAVQGFYTGQHLLDCPANGIKKKIDSTLIKCKIPFVFLDKPETAWITINNGIISFVGFRVLNNKMSSYFDTIKKDFIDQYGRPLKELTFDSKEVLIWCEESERSYSYARIELVDIFLTVEMVMPVNAEEKALIKSMCLND